MGRFKNKNDDLDEWDDLDELLPTGRKKQGMTQRLLDLDEEESDSEKKEKTKMPREVRKPGFLLKKKQEEQEIREAQEEEQDEEEVKEKLFKRRRHEDSWREMMEGLIEEDDKRAETRPKKTVAKSTSSRASTRRRVTTDSTGAFSKRKESSIESLKGVKKTIPETRRTVEGTTVKEAKEAQRIISLGKKNTGKKAEPKKVEKDEDEKDDSLSVDEEIVRNTFTENPRPKISGVEAEEMQKRLMLTYLLGPKMLEKRNLEVNEHDKMIVLTGIRDGRFNETNTREILTTIDDPAKKYGDDGIFRRLNGNEKERRILAYETGIGFKNFEQTDGVTVRMFREKFPLPLDFAAAADGFLKIIRKNSGDKTYGEYIEAMNDFKWQVYGQRQLYFEQIKNLERKAEQMTVSRTGLLTVDGTEMKEVLKEAIVDGDIWIDGRIERRLTPQILMRNGLGPRWKMEIGGVEIGMSSAFKMTDRDVVLVYVNTLGTTRVLSYYRNAQTGVWKYLPDYTLRRTSGGKIEIFCGVGYAEESLVLPAEIQKRLTEVAEEKPLRGLIDAPEFLFVGTAIRYDNPSTYIEARRERQLIGRVYGEVEMKPAVVFGTTSAFKTKPTELLVEDESASPDFSHVEFTWTMNTGMYGKITATSFVSRDATLLYTFFEDSKQRAWLENVEILNGEVTSTGLRSEWAYTGDLGTELYVPVRKSDGYGDDDDMRGGYISMWKRYVSRIPMIKEYLRAKLDRK